MTDEDDGFIGMPPGMVDVGTFKLPPKAERPRPPEREEIVFVPAAPGVPVAVPLPDPAPAPAPVPAPESAPESATGPAPAPAPAQTPAAWRLVLADGGEVPVERAVLVGRNPAEFARWPGAVLLPIVDTTQSVSKTHAAFEVDDSGLWVHDLDSTNGVWVVHGEDVTEVAPGRRVNVRAGSSIELGDYVLRVEH